MAKFILRAYPAHFQDEERKLRTFVIGADSLGNATIKAANLADIKNMVRAFGHKVAYDHPDKSFDVHIRLRDGRKPRGFDAAKNAGEFGTDAWMRVIPRVVA